MSSFLEAREQQDKAALRLDVAKMSREECLSRVAIETARLEKITTFPGELIDALKETAKKFFQAEIFIYASVPVATVLTNLVVGIPENAPVIVTPNFDIPTAIVASACAVFALMAGARNHTNKVARLEAGLDTSLTELSTAHEQEGTAMTQTRQAGVKLKSLVPTVCARSSVHENRVVTAKYLETHEDVLNKIAARYPNLFSGKNYSNFSFNDIKRLAEENGITFEWLMDEIDIAETGPRAYDIETKQLDNR